MPLGMVCQADLQFAVDHERFVLARASAGLADSTIRNDTGHLELIRDWFGRPLWEMQPADADSYFGKVDRRGAQSAGMPRGCRRSPAACTAAERRAAPVLREVHRERGMRVCFFMEEPAGRDLPGAGDLMARREITEAGQQRLDRYKQRRDEYLRKLGPLWHLRFQRSRRRDSPF